MIGVKAFIQEFAEPFNKADRAERKAKKNLKATGIYKPTKKAIEDEVALVIAEWDRKTQRGETYQATLCQKEVESNKDAILETRRDKDSGPKPERSDAKLEPNKVYLEKFLFSPKCEILGYADRIDTKGNIINITDNKVIDKLYRSSSFKTDDGFKVDGKRMQLPLKHLDDCNYVHAVLQLSLYMYLAWENNKTMKIGKLFIRHITMNDSDKVTSDELIEVPYLKDEVKSMLQYKLKNK